MIVRKFGWERGAVVRNEDEHACDDEKYQRSHQFAAVEIVHIEREEANSKC